ncbi:MAG: NUDIX domain-containing protein [Patescibacteria group bacterium]
MKPKVIIVDESDKVIGFKQRDQVDAKKDIYRVSVLWVTNSLGEVLLSRRSLSESHSPGQWHPAAAGTVEEGETYLTNVLKEAREEIGLDNIDPIKGPKIRIRKEFQFFAQIFTYQTDKMTEEFIINRDEISEVKWFNKVKLTESLSVEPNLYISSLPLIMNPFVDF